jgi:small subunit ribosomal protein S9
MIKLKQDKIMVSGKRKTAIAKALIQSGTGIIRINKINYESLPYFKRLLIQEPIEITKNVLHNFNFDINVKVRSGGKQSRIEATRVAIARALVKFTGSVELRKEFLAYDRNLLIADVRRKEAYKPNDSKARAKRQKSYR